MTTPISRRTFIGSSVIAGTGLIAGRSPTWPLDGAPSIITSDRLRPVLASGIQSGDVTASRGIVWSRSDRPARLFVDWSTSERFTNARTLRGPAALDSTGFTAAIDLSDLPADEQIFYRVRFESLESPGNWSEPTIGHFRTAPLSARPVRVAWSADMVGQGWGIDASRGGIRMHEALRRAEPDVFIHSGDNIYADQPLLAEVKLDDGTMWRNLVTEAKSKPAETLDDFRGCYAYNMLDDNVRRFHASVPMITQWDDHEVTDNWFNGQMLEQGDPRTAKSVSLLAARAKQAVFEFLPIRRNTDEAERVYRSFSYGPLLEIFVVDLRSYRGPNSANKQTVTDATSTILGAEQLAWLKNALRSSTAVWKVIASDMPIGLVVNDRMREGVRTYEAWANADAGPPAGRELELADLLRFIKAQRIRNTVWITGDVHYAAAHQYLPEHAAFTDFDPFWEFVAGPMHAGNFGPNALDMTFGPEVRFSTSVGGVKPNRPPSEGMQFYGTLDIDPRTRALTAGIWNVAGEKLWQTEIPAVR